MGLSPRVRGNRKYGLARPSSNRSIPACAGEPRRSLRTYCPAWVYPRVCGGTNVLVRKYHIGLGLSPRVRGNRMLVTASRQVEGSIPACAGEPRQRSSRPTLPRVYPRVCGGTRIRSSHLLSYSGLSPRVRGNPIFTRAYATIIGSIPACAGEPG